MPKIKERYAGPTSRHAGVGKLTLGEATFDWVNTLFMALLLLIFIYPFLNLLSISMSGDTQVLRSEVTFYPKNITWRAYDMIFDNSALWTSFGNSIFIALFGCGAGLIALCVAAYPLAFSDFHGKKIYNFLILFTLWFNGGMIPTFMVIRELGLIDSKWALVVNALINAYYVLIVRSYFSSISMSLIESARIDGANDFYILYKIVIPLSKPVLATVALWIIVYHWNDYFYPLMFLTKRENMTLQMVLKDIVLQANVSMYDMSTTGGVGDGVAAISEQVRNAVLVVSLLPMMALYPFLQRYFVSGVMLGAVKG